MKVNSYLSHKCEVRTSAIGGSGIFAVSEINADEIVSVWGGKIYTGEECEELGQIHEYYLTHTVSVGWGVYLGWDEPDQRDDAELFNHSCEANLRIVGQTVIVARRKIEVGEELTIDYDCSEAIAEPLDCHCNSPRCRKSISGFLRLTPSDQMANRQFASEYLTNASDPTLLTPLPVNSSLCKVGRRSYRSPELRLHSWLSGKCEVRESPTSGLGVFATEPIRQNELVAVWGGIVYTRDEVDKFSSVVNNFATQTLQIAEGFYLKSNSLTAIDDSKRFNHSCDPNIGVKGQILVLARRDIAVGDELCFDYETTDVHLDGLECKCGSSKCRKKLYGTSWLDRDFQQANQSWFSWYMQEKISQVNDKRPDTSDEQTIA